MSDFLSHLEHEYSAPVPFPFSRDRLEETAEHFLNFLRLPLEVKRSLHVPSDIHRQTADGYNDKLYIENKGKDRKEFFHYKNYLRDLPAFEKTATEYPETQAFFGAAAELFDAAETTMRTLFHDHFPEHYEKVFDEKGKSQTSVLRFLSYLPQEGEGFCAKAHYDKGVSTLAIAESAPGLMVGKDDKEPLSEVVHKDKTALFMPAILLHDYTDGGVCPTWHTVVHHTHEPNVTDFCARWAIVFFLNSRDSFFHEWDAVHKPLQKA